MSDEPTSLVAAEKEEVLLEEYNEQAAESNTQTSAGHVLAASESNVSKGATIDCNIKESTFTQPESISSSLVKEEDKQRSLYASERKMVPETSDKELSSSMVSETVRDVAQNEEPKEQETRQSEIVRPAEKESRVLLKDDEIQPLSAEKCEQNDKQTGSEEVPMKTLTAEQTNVFTDAGTDQNPRPESNLSALPDIEAVELHKGESKVTIPIAIVVFRYSISAFFATLSPPFSLLYLRLFRRVVVAKNKLYFQKSAEAKNQIDVELDLLMEEISHSEGTQSRSLNEQEFAVLMEEVGVNATTPEATKLVCICTILHRTSLIFAFLE